MKEIEEREKQIEKKRKKQTKKEERETKDEKEWQCHLNGNESIHRKIQAEK